MVIQTIAMLLQKKTIAIYPADKRRHSRDNKNLDYISSLEQQRSGAHRYVKIMTKPPYHTYAQSDVYKIDPVTEQMLITCVWPLRCKKRHEIKTMLLIIGNRTLMMKDLPTQDWIHQFENYTQTNHKRHNDKPQKIDILKFVLMVGSIQCLI
jgi:hypothetical protein